MPMYRLLVKTDHISEKLTTSFLLQRELDEPAPFDLLGRIFDKFKHAFALRADKRHELVAFFPRLSKEPIANHSAGPTGVLFEVCHPTYFFRSVAKRFFSGLTPSQDGRPRVSRR